MGFSVIVRSHTKGVKPKMKGRKLRNGVCWQGASKREDVKQVGRKTRALCPKGRREVRRLEQELDKDAFCRRLCSDLYSECLTKEAVEAFGDFKVGGQVIRPVKYADDVVLLAEEETVLQGMTDRVTAVGLEMNVDKN